MNLIDNLGDLSAGITRFVCYKLEEDKVVGGAIFLGLSLLNMLKMSCNCCQTYGLRVSRVHCSQTTVTDTISIFWEHHSPRRTWGTITRRSPLFTKSKGSDNAGR